MAENVTGKTVFFDGGTVEYQRAWDMQKRVLSAVESGLLEEFYFFVEHPPVYTSGIHFNEEDAGRIRNIIKIERGGGITFHGPGQVVVYPIVNLSRRKITVKDLILKIQDSVIRVLGSYGISGESRLNRETGIWVGQRKICSTGFYIKGSITMHGLALNVNTDLSYFRKVNPCGFSPDVMTSMREEKGFELDMQAVKKLLMEEIADVMNLSEIERIKEIGGINDPAVSELLSGTVP